LASSPTATIAAVLRSLGQHLPALLGFRLLSWTFTTVALAPLTAWLLGRLVETTGAPAVSNFAIGSFVLSPAGLAAVLAVGALLLATSYAEQAGFLRLAAAPPGGLRATVVLVECLCWLPALVRIGLWHVGAWGLALAPLALVAAGLWYGLLGEHDINWYLDRRPPAFLFAAGVVGLLAAAGALLALWIYLRWFMALPLHVFQGMPVRQALRESAQLFSSKRRLVLRRLASWWIPALLISSAAGLAWNALEVRTLDLAVALLRAPVAAIGLLVALELGAGAAFAFVAASGHAILHLDLYRELTGAAAASAPADARTRARFARVPRLAPLLWLSAAALLATGVASAWAVVDRTRIEREVSVTAHRGCSSRAPENTLAAVRAALEEDVDLIEIDVQTTRDGEVVVIHDFDLMRVAGVPRKIGQLSLADLAGIDIGSHFDPAFAGERVPTLREVIRTVGERSGLLVEIKDDGSDPELARRVVDVLRQEGFDGRLLIMSLELRAVRAVRGLAPEWPVGLIVSQSVGDVLREDVDFVAVRSALATAGFVARSHSLGKEVHAWTVDDPQVASALADRGVDNLITNVPAVVRSALRARAELEPAERLLLGYRNRRIP